MSAISLLFFIAIATQHLTDIMKAYLPENLSQKLKFPVPRYIALLISLGLSFAFRADMLSVMGLSSSIPYFGTILTGVVTSMGSSYLYDFLSLFKGKSPQSLELPTPEVPPPSLDILSHPSEASPRSERGN